MSACEHAMRDEAKSAAALRRLMMEDAFPREIQRIWLGELLEAFDALTERLITLEARIADRDARLPLRAEHRTIADMIAYVADKLVTTSAALRGRERDERYVMGRQIIAYAAQQTLGADFKAIGRALDRTALEVAELHDRAELRRRAHTQFQGLLELVLERFSEARG